MTKRLRKLWLIVHRWLGLTAGLLFVLIGVTGSLLVFHREIDEWLNPEMLHVAGSGAQRTIEEVIAVAEERHSGQPALFVDVPRNDLGVWTVWFPKHSEHASGLTQVYVDPFTADVTGRRVWGEYLMTWLYRLHFKLLGGETGETIVGVTGLVLMISVLSGLFLWWPLWKNSWRAAFAIRRGRRLNYDLHKATGFASAAILLVLAFTGVYMIFPEWIKPCVTVFVPETVSDPDALHSRSQTGLKRIDPDRAVAITRKAFPDAELKRLYLPDRQEDVYIARVRLPGEVRRSSGNTRVWIDQYSGEVLAVHDWNNRNVADAFFAWQFPLHNGEAFGLIGRWIVFIAGMTPAALYVTGVTVWIRRRRTIKKRVLTQRAHPETDSGRSAARSTGC